MKHKTIALLMAAIFIIAPFAIVKLIEINKAQHFDITCKQVADIDGVRNKVYRCVEN